MLIKMIFLMVFLILNDISRAETPYRPLPLSDTQNKTKTLAFQWPDADFTYVFDIVMRIKDCPVCHECINQNGILSDSGIPHKQNHHAP